MEGVRELRQHVRTYLRRLRACARLEATERGRPDAGLPIVDECDPIARLEREGRILRRVTGDLSETTPLKLERPLNTILQDLREDTV
jgi:hypothetical protein